MGRDSAAPTLPAGAPMHADPACCKVGRSRRLSSAKSRFGETIPPHNLQYISPSSLHCPPRFHNRRGEVVGIETPPPRLGPIGANGER